MSGILGGAGPDVLQRPTAASDLGILLRSDNETALSFTLDLGAAVGLLAKVLANKKKNPTRRVASALLTLLKRNTRQVEMLSGVNVVILPSTRRQAFKAFFSFHHCIQSAAASVVRADIDVPPPSVKNTLRPKIKSRGFSKYCRPKAKMWLRIRTADGSFAFFR